MYQQYTFTAHRIVARRLYWPAMDQCDTDGINIITITFIIIITIITQIFVKYSHSASPDRTTLPAPHFRSSGLLCHMSDGLKLATGQSPWPGAQQQQLQTIAEDEPILMLLLSTLSAVEMSHDSALYRSIIDTDILTLTVHTYKRKTIIKHQSYGKITTCWNNNAETSKAVIQSSSIYKSVHSNSEKYLDSIHKNESIIRYDSIHCGFRSMAFKVLNLQRVVEYEYWLLSTSEYRAVRITSTLDISCSHVCYKRK